MPLYRDEEFQEFEFAVGERDTFDPYQVPVKLCTYRSSFNKPGCVEPVNEHGLFCEAHHVYITLGSLQQDLRDGDMECAEMHLEDMGLTLDDLKGRVEMGVAA